MPAGASSQISGVGVFAAGPYLTQKPYPADIHQQVADLASQGKIDPVAELGGDKVYIWHGSLDTIVPVCECRLSAFFLGISVGSWQH